MSYTLQQSINWAETFIEYSPLSAGTGGEPAVSIANMTQNTIMNSPFVWGWNRNENSTLLTLQPGVQDYVVNLTDFSFLEKITLIDPNGVTYEIIDIHNTATLGKGNATTAKQNRPNSACVNLVNYGTSVTIRFLAVPDQVYKTVITYQKLPVPLTTTSSTWGIPDQYLDIYNNLFLGEVLANVDDARSTIYRQRGVTALLSKSEGLSEMDKNMFLDQFWARDSQQTSRMMRTQEGNQSRAV